MNAQGKILLADDERVFLRSTAALLQQEGYECVCASTGTMAMELLQANGFDLLITDLRMPGNLELEVLQGAARHAAGAPIIIITAYPSVATALSALHLPVVDYLVKPFDFSKLLAAVRSGLAFASTYRALNLLQQHSQTRRVAPSGLRHWLSLNQHNAAVAIENLLAFTLQFLADRSIESPPQTERLGQRDAEAEVVRRLSHQVAAGAAARTDGVMSADAVQWKNALVKIARVLQDVGFPTDVQSSSLWTTAFGDTSPLSLREQQILRCLLSGQRASDIARSLSLSRHTVRNHLRSIFRKLNVHSQSELLFSFTPRLQKDL
jgi:DNA-binding NarL/FixJ family response regulator